MRLNLRTRALIAGLVSAALVAVAGAALADTQAVSDRKSDNAALRSKPEIDIVRATAGHAVGGKLKHKVTMRGKLTPAKKNTRPFILINTKGPPSSAFEFLVLGRSVFEVKGERLRKVGNNKFEARKRTWVYRFDPKSFGNPRSYGWAALTSKGKTTDLAPNRRFAEHSTAPNRSR